MATPNEDNINNLHIVVFPWLAFGHMLPFLELSKSLARRGHKVSFISTPRNIHRLPKLPPQLSSSISFIPLELPKVEGLREAAEATIDLPPDEVPFLKKAIDGLEQPFAKFVEGTSPKPDWIIQDFVQHWIPKLGIPCVFYIGFPAADLVFFGPLISDDNSVPSRRAPEDFTVPPPWVPFATKVAYRLHEVCKLFQQASLPCPSGVTDSHRYQAVIGGCKAISPRSCQELESEWLRLMEKIFKKPIIPVGLLPPSADERKVNLNEKEVAEIMEWLDTQSSSSVVYVALGTEAMISLEMIQELAFGLEAAKVPFVWALRRPFNINGSVEMLPSGFQERTAGFGIAVTGWVPQVEILAHQSVGGFLTHCGWSSIIEGLQAGRPLVLLPIALDQGLNARLMEEKGVGIEVERDEEDGSFTRENVAKAIRLVMVDDKGEPYRKKAQEMTEIASNKELHEKYVEDFIQYLVTGYKKIGC